MNGVVNWKRMFGLVTATGILAVAGGLIAAGEAKSNVQRDLKDHGERLDKIEPTVEMLPAIKEGVDRLERDVREIRNWLQPHPPGR